MTNFGRRDFLKLSGGTAGLLFLSATLRPTLANAHFSLFSRHSIMDEHGDVLWSGVKDEFSLRDGLVMFNAANLAPMPRKLAAKQYELSMEIDADPSFSNRDKFVNFYNNGVESLAQFIGADFDEVAITRNASESNNLIVKGLNLSANDEVVIWGQNHPSNNLSWEVEAQRKGFKLIKVSTPKHPTNKADLITPFLEALGDKTRVLAITHVSNDTGVRLPIKDLIEIVKERDIFTLVDGAQSLGVLNIDVKELGMDCFTGSLHKWPCGPKETGLLYLKKERHKNIHPSIITVDFEEGPYLCSGRFSAMSQRDDAAIAVISDMVNFHQQIGKENIEARVLMLAGELKKKLTDAIPDIKFVTPRATEQSAAIVFFQVPNIDYNRAYYDLYDRYKIALDSWVDDSDPFYSGLRLCPHLYNSMDDIDYAVDAIARFKA